MPLMEPYRSCWSVIGGAPDVVLAYLLDRLLVDREVLERLCCRRLLRRYGKMVDDHAAGEAIHGRGQHR